MNISKCWSADFETTTDPNDCRVWAYSLSNIEEPEKFLYGNSLDSFMEWCANPKENYTLFYFNLKFDSAFILDWLFRNDFEYINDSKDRKDQTFTTLITDLGQFFCIDIYFHVHKHNVNKVRIMDAQKIFPNFSVESLAEGFGLPISKLKLDYHAYREIGHTLTKEEIDYIRNDVEIVARCLKAMFDKGMTKMTIASDAMSNFKDHFKYFRLYFPKLEEQVDEEIRKSYRGGFTYVNEKYKEKKLGAGVTLDVNSLYPSVQRNMPMPFGQPVIFEGKYEYDSTHPLYIQVFNCVFELKEGKIPTIQLKNNLNFQANEYLKSSNHQIVTLYLTKPDFELFMENYNCSFLHYLGGFKFKSKRGFFDKYIDYWMGQKIKASKEHNPQQRMIAKLALNSLYGKFGLSPKCGKKEPYFEDGVVRFRTLPKETREAVYIPVACFITAYGRCKTIRTAQAIRDWSIKNKGYDAYVYSDTDSIKALLSNEDLEILKKDGVIDLDDYELGFWALEETYDSILAIRQKCYIIQKEDKCYPTVAGLPKYLAPLLNMENFKKGFTTKGKFMPDIVEMAKENGATEEELEKIHHKLTYKYVKGGVILADTDFTIK